MFTPARTRVYRELLRLEETGIATSAEGWIQLGQEELAMLTGTTRATVNRALRDAERAELIRLARGKTQIVNRPALQRLAR